MTRLAAYCAGWSSILDGVLVDLEDVCASCEKSRGGRSASTASLVDVRPVLFFLHIELGEPAHDRVRQTLVVILAHLPIRERAPHGESKGSISKRSHKAIVEIPNRGWRPSLGLRQLEEEVGQLVASFGKARGVR